MMSTHKIYESLITDSSASKVGWSGLSQNSSDFKTKHSPQRKDSITDDPAPETGESVITQRSSDSSVGDMIEEFRDLDKQGQGFTSADPLEEIDIGNGKTPRPTFVNKTLETDPRNEMIGLLKEYSDCFAWNYTEMPGLSREIVEHRLPIKSCFRPFKQRAKHFVQIFSHESRMQSTGCWKLILLDLADTHSGSPILCRWRRSQVSLEYALIFAI
jgi:hypothetical protein